MRDYRGHGKATQPMLPSIGVPTTAGTGSDAQSYAMISDAETHAKMACGDRQGRVPRRHPRSGAHRVAAGSGDRVAGYDAISHAVESYVTDASHGMSRCSSRARPGGCSRRNYERVLAAPADLAARGAMLLGAHEAGIAIEQSMLGATHACANPLTARYGTTHGIAIAVMLPHVVRWNRCVGERYAGAAGDRGSCGRASARAKRWPRDWRRSRARRPAGDAARDRCRARRSRRPGGRRGDAVDRHLQPTAVRRAAALELYERAFWALGFGLWVITAAGQSQKPKARPKAQSPEPKARSVSLTPVARRLGSGSQKLAMKPIT